MKGRARLAANDYSRALLEFRNAAAAAPRDAEPYYLMGMAHMASGNIRAAGAALQRCAELNPQHSGARLKVAELMAASRNQETVETAASRLRELLEASPENLEAREMLSIAEWRLGSGDAAMARLAETLQQFPSSLSSAVTLARMKLSRKDLAGAEEVLKSAVGSIPGSPAASLALGELYLITKQYANAEAELLRAVQLDDKNGPALLGLAAIQAAANRPADADRTYRKISALPGKEYKPLHALYLYQTGHRDAGLAELLALAKQDPSDRTARTRLIAAYLDMGKTAEAQTLLAEILKGNAKDTDALSLRSGLYLQLGMTNEARRDLEQVLHYKPDDSEAHRAIARCYKAEGQKQNERRELMEALRLRPESLLARIALSRNFLAANEAKPAIQVLEDAPGAQKAILSVIVERNWALLALGDTQNLRASLEQALKAGRHPALVLQDALLQSALQNYGGARDSAEEVLKSNPQDVRAARIIAESYASQNQPGKALERLSELAKSAPASAGLQHLLGQWHLRTGNPDQARQALEAAKSAQPDLVAADMALAELDHEQNHAEAAARRLASVLNRNPGNVPALLLLAEVEKSSGNQASAVARYRAVLAADSSNLVALNNLSMGLAMDRPDEALGFAQRALEAAPDNPAVQDTLGWIYYRKGIYASASKYLKAAVAKEPTPRRQFHLAMSWMKLGERAMGQEMLRTALRQDPNVVKTESGW